MNVALPDGRVVEFPDSMGQPEIEAALAKEFRAQGASVAAPPAVQTLTAAPAQDTSWLRYPRGVLQAAETAVGRVAGLPGDLLAPFVPKEIPELGEGAIISTLPTSNEVVDFLGRHGIGQTADVMAQGPGEKALFGGVQGGVQSALLGAPGLIAGPLGPFLAGVAGGAAGGAVEGATGSPAAGMAAGGLVGAGGAAVLARQSLEKIASSLGGSQTLEDAGEALQGAARHWKANVMPAQEALAWAPVDAAIPAGEPTHLHNFSSALDEIVNNAPSQQRVVAALTPSLPRDLRANLQLTTTAGPTASGQAGVALPLSTWQDARTIRTALGNAMSNPRLVRDLGQQNIKHLYSALTMDLNDTATSLGADDLFSAANAESTRLHLLAEGPMSRLARGLSPEPNDPAPEKLATSLLRGGGASTDLQALRGEIPEAVDELAAAHLRSQPRGWLKQSPETQEALVVDPGLRAGVWQAMPSPPPRVGSHSLQAIASGTAAHAAGMILGALFPGTSTINPMITGAASELAGMGAPSAYRAGRNLLAPRRLEATIVPSIAGANTSLTQPQ